MLPSPRPEELLAAILSSDTEATCIFTVDGTVLAWGLAAERLYGYSEAEIVGRPMTMIVPPRKTAGPQHLPAKCNDCKTRAKTRERLHKKGFLLRVNVMRSVVRDGTGKPIAIVERAHALKGESTIGSDIGLRAVLEQVPALIWTTDRNLRITANWGAVTQLTGVKPGELIGRTVYDFLRDEKDGRPVAAAQPARFVRGSSSSIEVRLRDRDYEIRLEPLRDAARGIAGYIAAGFDIEVKRRSVIKLRTMH
jgi:PAS domain S-box-containing protein